MHINTEHCVDGSAGFQGICIVNPSTKNRSKFHEIPPHKNKSSKRIETHNLKYYANNDHHDNYAAGPKLGASKKEKINKMIYVHLGI